MDTDNHVVATGGKAAGRKVGVKAEGAKYLARKEDSTLGGRHTV